MSPIRELHLIDPRSGHISRPRWSPNGRLLAVPAESGSIGIFDIESGKIRQTLGPHSGEVTSVCWDRDSELVMSGSLDHSVGVWELSSGNRAPFTPPGHKEPVHSVEWTDEGAYAMTCSMDRVCAWDGYCLQTGWTEQMEDNVNQSTGFTAAACSWQTTLLLAVAADRGALLVLASLISADVLGSFRLDGPARCLAWSPREDLLLAASGTRIVAFHATEAGFEGSPRELTTETPGVHALAFSGDGRLLASRDAHGLKIWDVRSAKLIVALHEEVGTFSADRPVTGIAFHPTEPLLAAVTPTENQLRILDLAGVV